jgi:hypothetical protein
MACCCRNACRQNLRWRKRTKNLRSRAWPVQIIPVVLTPADKTPAKKPAPDVPLVLTPPASSPVPLVEPDQDELAARRFARRALERDDSNLTDDYREFFAQRKRQDPKPKSSD